MPPRRSGRTRASVEPESVIPPTTSKRKRNGAHEAEQENIKPASRTRRSTSAQPMPAQTTKGPASTRSRPSLEQVLESDEEVHEEPARPAKKSRPSLEPEGSDSNDEIVQVKAKTRRAAAQKAASRVETIEVEDSEDELASIKAKTRRPPSKRSATVKAETEEEDYVPPSKGHLSAASSTSKRASTSSARGSRSTASARKMKVPDSEPETVLTSDDDGVEIIKPPRGKGKARAAKTVRVVEDSDEEETLGVAAPPPETMKVKKERGVKTVVKQEKQAAQKMPEPVELHAGEEPAEEAVKERDNQEVTETSDTEETNEVLTAVLDSKEAGKEQQEEEHSLLDPSKSPTPRPQTAPAAPEEPQGPKARLVIHKMALVNFKSYAGRQEIGPFHKSFSAIVGPNGSGKSNTIDALLFVFGYRASKMRQGKLSELIHNSARHPDLDECSVEVHFREIIDLPGPDAFEVVPGSQLVVARTAYKNNSSRYTINGRQSNYKEVQTLLKGRGIDLDHNRFLILQGEVESIAQMKPKAASEHEDGLLEYLEDIIGTSQYKEPIEETLVEVERLSEDRMDKLNRLRIVERDRNALEAKKREAEDYLRMKNEHIRALSQLWQYYLWQCFVNEEAYEKAMARLEKELADETERNRDDILHLELLQKHYDERCAAYEEVREAAAAAVKDLAAQEKKVVGLEERKKHANGKTKKLRKSLQEDEHHYAEAKRAIEDNSAKMDREKAKVEELETSLAEEEKALERIRDSLKDKTQVFHDQIEVKQKELQPWTVKINQKQAEIDLATSERDMLAKKAEAAKTASQEAREALERLQAEHSTKMEELKELQATKAGNAKEVKESERKAAEMQARVQQLRSKASSARQKVDEAKASQAASTSQNKVLDSLTRLKNAGRISGFHGRLGSLGTILDKYDVAVSTACGALNNLVVDTVEQGQACIEYLRKQNIGRASFMVLEKLSNRGMEKIPTPENVPRLFDLIKPKEARFASAFFKGLGNTLVANDLEQANRIAFGGQRRWRVVTLAGQLIDSSGTMSGGGNHVSRGGMSSKLQADAVSPDVLRRYEQESEEAARELEACQQQLREVEAELDVISSSGPQLDIAIDKISLDIRTGSKRISEAEKRYRELKAQTKPDAGDMARIAILEKDIAASTERLEALQAKTNAIEAEIQALEKKILEIGGARLLSQKSTVDGIRLHINLANDEITKAEVAKAKAEKDCVKLKSTIKNNTEALEEVERDLEELNAELKEITDYVDQLREQVEAAQVAVENSKDDLEGLKSELDAKNEGIQEFRQKEMELQQKLNDTKKEAKENDRTIEHWQNEHDKLRLEDVDDEDEDEEVVKAEGGEDIVKPDPEEARKRKEPLHELHVYSADELSAFRKKDLIAETELLDENLKNSRPDLSVLKDYRKREEEFLRRAQDLEEVTKERDAKKAEYDNLRKRRLDEFMAGFSTISLKLKEMYQMITLGGNAELELVDSMDPFSEGIIFSVMPPKKSWKNISNLSGGEKTLSSLALVFALHVYKPTPLYFMDEIDAALDFRNVSIVANYIKDRTKNAQFIIISLRNDMFELSHRLIGIYKTANATRSISIDNQPLNAIPVNAILA